jgi:hypothetical protein
MRRRSKFAVAAEQWFSQNGASSVSSQQLWNGLCVSHPDLTTPSETRKTPRTTCMRDLRKDGSFVVGRGLVRLAAPSEQIQKSAERESG